MAEIATRVRDRKRPCCAIASRERNALAGVEEMKARAEYALLKRVRLDRHRRQNDRRLKYQDKFRVKSRRETLIPGTPVLRVVTHETPPSEHIIPRWRQRDRFNSKSQ